jgi:hypothetical protein
MKRPGLVFIKLSRSHFMLENNKVVRFKVGTISTLVWRDRQTYRNEHRRRRQLQSFCLVKKCQTRIIVLGALLVATYK